MKISNSIKVLILMSAMVCCPLSYAKSTQPTDAQITSNIQSAFAADKMTANLDVHVSSKNRVVALSGKVDTDSEAEKLIQIAESTDGVKDVKASNLTVKESKHTMTDTMITAKVKAKYASEKLFGDSDVSVMGVKVETTDGIVSLSGTVDSQEQADNAVTLAKKIKGVKKVDSKLEVKTS